MKHNEPRQDPGAQSELLTRELDEAELFVQKLRACVVAIRDQPERTIANSMPRRFRP